MKRRLVILAFGGSLFWTLGFVPTATSELRVQVSGTQSNTPTKVWVSIFSESDFLKRPIERKSVTIENGKASLVFSLPPGEYALSTYHDLNGNDKLDRHFYGKPKEPYGFSNNITPKFGPPKYEKCKFTLGNSTKTLSITLID